MSRNIAIVIHALHGGGAERVAATMANQWADQGHSVSVITLDTVDSDDYEVDARVRRVGLNLMRTSRTAWQAFWNNRARVRRVRRALLDVAADCVVSVTDRMNVVTLLACRPLAVPVVIAEHSDPRHQRMSRAWERLRQLVYPRCAAAVVLTDAVARYLQPVVRDRPVFVIPNGVDRPEQVVSETQLRKGRTVVAMGRLSPEKGFDRLIHAFAKIAERNPQWQLDIAGEGPERARLEDLIQQHGLKHRVHLCGWVERPAEFLGRGGVFVLPSHYEGFPVALLEAMACGLAVVSFECDSGPKEIIRHESDGLLVPAGDVPALAAALERLMQDPDLRCALGARAQEITDRFSSQVFARRWDEVLDRTT